jgi:hypothetical protein
MHAFANTAAMTETVGSNNITEHKAIINGLQQFVPKTRNALG